MNGCYLHMPCFSVVAFVFAAVYGERKM